ncbi:MAG: trigger factor [Eubacterium sp.]|nr:trigger factor [Eubacterium sp.]
MKIRKISAVLIGAMVLSVLGGCGKKTEETLEQKANDYEKFVTLGEYKGVEYTPQVTKVTEDDIQSEVDKLISDNTTENQIKNRVATMGDAVNIDYVGYVDDKAFEGGDTQGQGTVLTLGSKQYIDTFEEQVAGHSPGDAFDVNVTFPENYGNTDLAGKKAKFETKLNYIVEKVEPKLDDTLIASATDYKTVDEFKKATREHLEEQAKESDLSADKNAVISKVVEASNVSEYPEQQVTDRIQKMVDSVTQSAESNGMSLGDYLKNFGYDEETFKAQVKESVQTYIRERMIILTIAGKEGIKATEDEVEAKKQELLDQSGITDIETLKSTYGYEDDDFEYEIIYNKVVDLVYENAKAVANTDSDAEKETPTTPSTTEATTEATTEQE